MAGNLYCSLLCQHCFDKQIYIEGNEMDRIIHRLAVSGDLNSDLENYRMSTTLVG